MQRQQAEMLEKMRRMKEHISSGRSTTADEVCGNPFCKRRRFPADYSPEPMMVLSSGNSTERTPESLPANKYAPEQLSDAGITVVRFFDGNLPENDIYRRISIVFGGYHAPKTVVIPVVEEEATRTGEVRSIRRGSIDFGRDWVEEGIKGATGGREWRIGGCEVWFSGFVGLWCWKVKQLEEVQLSGCEGIFIAYIVRM
ncbi:hypothetical protein M5K25_024802 [Dendrobium thyrsiflorum]|uniref:Uncharacterized protein n=1 Tax=Dendrobium thyrsiflorum TaxID=117978 RepID=A0ABD0U342_DENTH